MFLGFAVVGCAFAGGEAPRLFQDAPLSQKIGAFEGAVFVCGAEDHPVAEVQGKDLRFVPAEGRDRFTAGERCLAERCQALTATPFSPLWLAHDATTPKASNTN